MHTLRQHRGWFLIGLLAISVALLLMLVPHGHGADHGGLLAILPLLFVGVISPLTLFPAIVPSYASRIPEAPARPSSFQRPPPFHRG